MILEIAQLLVDLALAVGLLHLWRQVRRLEKKPPRPIPAAKGSSVPVDVVTVLLALLACGGVFAQPPVEPTTASGIDADKDGTREISVSGGAISFDANDDGNPAEMVLNSNAQLVLTYPGYGYPFGEVVKITTTGQTLSFYQSGAGGRAQVYSTNRLSLQGGNGSATIELGEGGADTIGLPDRVVYGPSTATCTDSGDGSPGAATITPTTPFVQLTNSDADGCAVTLSESGAVSGQGVEIVVVSSAGGTVDFADTAGVTELAGALLAGQWDSLTLRYAVDRWVETSRSNN